MTQTREPVYLIDATALIFRGYFGSNPMEAQDGTPTQAVFGFTQLVLKFLRVRRPTSLCLVFDAGAKTFRNRLYPEYKANRGEPPEDLRPQFDICVEVGRALGLPVAIEPDYEADDLLATLAARCEQAGRDVLVVTVDKDLAQIVTERVQLFDPSRETTFGLEGVMDRFGVVPARVPDWLALVGDTSDNIPGVPGVGARTASALLGLFDGLDGLYADLDAVAACDVRRARSVAEKLAAHKPTAYLARELATVRRDAPVSLGVDDLSFELAPVEAFEPLFDRLGFGWVAKRVDQLREG